jgi:hypothetical protein
MKNKICLYAFSYILCLLGCSDHAEVMNRPPVIANLSQSDHIMCAGGYEAKISFQLIDLDNEPVSWMSTLENSRGGSLDISSGRPLQSGSDVVIHFRSGEATEASINITAFDASGDQAEPEKVSILVGSCIL